MNTPRDEGEAEAMGWTVDRHTHPWVAYVGPRFSPDHIIEIDTPAHVAARSPLHNAVGKRLADVHDQGSGVTLVFDDGEAVVIPRR